MLTATTAGDGNDIERERVQRRLAQSLCAPITLVLGPAGSGKSVTLRACPELRSAIFYRVGGLGAALVSFVRGMSRAVGAVSSGAQISFAQAWERSLQAHSPEDALAYWMHEHLAECDTAVVFDDLHAATENPSIAAFIAKFAELRAPRKIVVAARGCGLLPTALWMATGIMEPPIDESDLRFDRADVLRLAAQLGDPVSETQAQAIVEQTDGLAIAAHYALSLFDRTTHPSFEFLTSPQETAAAIFRRRTDEEREFLLACSIFPVVVAAALESMGWPDPGRFRRAMGADAIVIFDLETYPAGQLRDGFRRYLATFLATCDDERRVSLALRAVRALEANARVADALTVAAQQRLPQALARLTDAHGLAILESGQLDVISEAMTGLDPTKGGVASALLGYLESGLGRLDTSEAWFALGLETAEHPLSRVTIALFYARELMHRRRADAFTILAPYADADDLPVALQLDVRSSFAQALLIAGRVEEASRRTDQVVAMLGPEFPAAAHARVLVRAAYVAIESGAIETARQRAQAALPLALGECLYDAATSAYSVLYNIAYDHDDDATASMRYLQLLRTVGAKAGTLRADLYAAVAMYELHAEAGDATHLDGLARDISRFDVHYATPEVTEGLLPAKALQAGWSGDFARAHRMLLPTAEHQASGERNALRWAEIGLYAAAAGDTPAALAAAEMALDHLAGDQESVKRRATAVLLLSLTFCLLGHAGRAQEYAARGAAIAASLPRTRAFGAAVACISANLADPRNLRVILPSTLAHLRDLGYGGLALLIEALPYEREGIRTTIGAVIASGKRADGTLSTPRVSGTATRQSDVITGELRLPLDEIDAQIDRLICELDGLSPQMAEHSRAVSAWSGRIARKLGLTDAEVAFLMRCGLVHDVGKIMTPSAILNAPRRLSVAEWSVMKTHVDDGAMLVSGVSSLVEFVPIVRGHHERIDGHGYPNGLRGGGIPLAARIVTVADSFNAMIGRRSYQPPRAPTDALEELYRHSHSQFDPEIVQAMAQVVLGTRFDHGIQRAAQPSSSD